MSRNMPTLIVPEAANIPTGNITALEWTAAQGQADRADTRVYDVRKYGAIGTADDSPAINAAIAAASAAGGGVVTMPPGTYITRLGIQLFDNIHLDLTGVTLDFRTMDATTRGPFGSCIWATGTYTPMPTFAVQGVKGSHTQTFASAPGLAVGDIIMIEDETDYSFSAHRTYYHQGEFARVQELAPTVANSIRFEQRFRAGYTVKPELKLYKITPLTVSITGLTVLAFTNSRTIWLDWCTGIKLHNISVYGAAYCNIGVNHSYDVSISQCRTWATTAGDSGTEYGLLVGNCQKVSVVNNSFDAMRHGITVGGSDLVGSISSRDLLFTGNMVTSHGDVSPHGMSMHGNAEYVVISNNVLNNGCLVGGDHVLIEGNLVVANTSMSGISFASEPSGGDVSIINNTVYAENGWIEPSYGAINVQLSFAAKNGTVTVRGNKVHLGTYKHATVDPTRAILVRNFDSPAQQISVTVADNMIESTASWGTSTSDGIYIDCTGAARFEHIIVRNNVLMKMGIKVTGAPHESVTITGNRVADAPAEGIIAAFTGITLTSACILTIHDNQVEIANKTPILVRAAAQEIVIVNRNLIRSGNLAADASVYLGAGIYIFNATTAEVTGNFINNIAARLTKRIAYDACTTVFQADTKWMSTDVDQLGTITSYTVNEIMGTAAPTFTAAIGSVVRLRGGTGSAMYVRESTGWVAK